MSSNIDKFINFLNTIHNDEHIQTNLLYLLLTDKCVTTNIDKNGNIIAFKSNMSKYDTIRMQHELIKYFNHHKQFVLKAIKQDNFKDYAELINTYILNDS